MNPLAALSWLWTHRGPAAIVAGGLAVAALWTAWRHDHAALAKARAVAEQRAEAAELQAKRVTVAAEIDHKEMAKLATRLGEESEAFEAELERVKAAAPGAKVVYVDRLVSGSSAAHGTPREEVQEQRGSAGVAAPAPFWEGVTPVAAPCGAERPVCLLAEGDRGHVVARVAAVRARAGTLAVLGEGECWRDVPGPATVVLRGTFEAASSTAAEAADVIRLEAPRPRFALRAGPDWSEWRPAPTGAIVAGGLRVVGAWWLEAEGRISAAPGASLQLRREF